MMEGIRRWEVCYNLMRENGYRTFCEVGCKEGKTTEYILSGFDDAKEGKSRVIAIDPWQAIPNEEETYEDWDYNAIAAEFWRRVEPWRDRLLMMRKTSEDAAAEVKNESLDLVFIDAAHDEESVYHDIDLWFDKVRPGGMVCGHDWQHRFPGVQRACARHFNLMHVQTFPDSVWGVAK